MIPNIVIHPIMGKLLFCVVDLLVAWILLSLLNSNSVKYYEEKKHDRHTTTNSESNLNLILTNATVLFNPILVNVSTRGNADQCIVLLVLLSLYALQKKQFITSSIWFGLAVHFKIYPIIYLPTILIYMWFYEDSLLNVKVKIKACVWYCLISGSVCLALIGIFYYMYGYEFLYESYLYHVVRSDNRHNFSVYFYYLYLGGSMMEKNSSIVSLLAFLPQFIALLALSWNTTRKNFHSTIFSQTFLFVMFNKVCTVQYFVWYIALFGFPLQTYFYERMKSQTRFVSMFTLVVILLLWFVGQGIWLSYAYKLEFLGENTFREIWMSSTLFFLINSGIAIYFRPQ